MLGNYPRTLRFARKRRLDCCTDGQQRMLFRGEWECVLILSLLGYSK